MDMKGHFKTLALPLPLALQLFSNTFSKPPPPLPLSLPLFHILFESFPLKVKLNVTLHIKMIINKN
jgi:hypothetical protein